MRYCGKENRGFHLQPIYCDNHLLILNKPSGVATQPEFHLEAKEWVKATFAKPGAVFLEPIHRLDKPVSGIVVFARTSKALSRLNEALRLRKIRKFYLAIVEGEMAAEGTLTHYLVHGDFEAHVVGSEDPRGKKALLHYKREEVKHNRSLIEVELETGRYHQIRAQFGAIGSPIWGDSKYGSQVKKESIALHHHRLLLEHPTTKEQLVFESPAPFSL